MTQAPVLAGRAQVITAEPFDFGQSRTSSRDGRSLYGYGLDAASDAEFLDVGLAALPDSA